MIYYNDFAEKLLEQREQRADFQTNLQRQAKDSLTLVVIKANCPGADKSNCETTFLTSKAYFLLKEQLKVDRYYVTSTQEGLIYYLLVQESLQQAKQTAMALEHTAMGRLLDIDVFCNHQTISRSAFFYPPRRCLLCEDDAKHCSVSGKHSYAELMAQMKKIVYQTIFTGSKADIIENLTIYGLCNELNKPYGFGCVGINDSGSHHDMDVYTFLSSVAVLKKGLREIPSIDSTSFAKLRAYGQLLEQKMLVATGGVNTYKGANFILILLFAGWCNAQSVDQIVAEIKNLTINILEDFHANEDPQKKTHGVAIYEKFQLKGIRGEAHRGFALFFDTFEPFYQQRQNLMQLYLLIISKLDDTTIIHRTSLERLHEVKQKAVSLLDNPSGWKDFDGFCKEHRISCGGSADTLATVLIIHLLKNHNQQNTYANKTEEVHERNALPNQSPCV